MKEKLSAIRERLKHLPGQHKASGRRKLAAILAAIVVIVGLCVFGATRIYNRYHGGTVNVYSFTDVGLDAMMVEDGMDMEGTVSTDQLQTEYLSDSEKIDKVYVKKGQKVKEGDKLFSYDSTLTKLDLQRKNIEIQKKELALDEAKKRLSVIKTYRAGVPIKNSVADDIGQGTDDSGDEDDPDAEDEETAVFDAGVTNLASIRTLGGDSDVLPQDDTIQPLSGSGTQNDPYNYEWKDGYVFDDAFLGKLTQGKNEAYVRFFLSGTNAGLEEKQQKLEQLQQQLDELNTELESKQAEWDAEKEQLQSDLEEAQGQLEQSQSDLQNSQTEIQELKNLAGQIVAYFLDLSSESEDESEAQLFEELQDLVQNAESADDLKQKLEAFLKKVGGRTETDENDPAPGETGEQLPADGTEEESSSDPTSSDADSVDEQEIVVDDQSMEDSTIQAVAQTLEARQQTAQVKPLDETEDITASEESEDGGEYFTSWLMHIQKVNGSYRYLILSINVGGLERTVADPLPKVDHPTEPGDNPGDEPGDEPGGGYTDGTVYTRAQLAQLITQASEEVKTLERDLKKLRIEYRKQQIEADADTVYAKVDGVVTTLRDPDKAGTEKAFIKVSGDGAGYKISGTVSELELDRAEPGASVTVNNEEIGEAYQGKVEKVLKYPTESSGWDYAANSNVSYYPFTVKVDDSAEFNLDDYITISFDKTEEENASVYLMKCFIRSEDGRSYIYVAGEDGKLEKRYVSTGKDVWGYYTEIKNGLSEGEMVAFPYGQHVREGAPTQEASIEALYTE